MSTSYVSYKFSILNNNSASHLSCYNIIFSATKLIFYFEIKYANSFLSIVDFYNNNNDDNYTQYFEFLFTY